MASTASSNPSLITERRIRHITGIQIRNLTPFPVRDAFASALSQPAGQSQFTSHGHLSDDLDVTLSRKRTRRTSLNSVTTHQSFHSDDGIGDEEGLGASQSSTDGRGRRRVGSRVSLSGGSLASSTGSIGRTHPHNGSAPPAKPNRPRTTSIASSLNQRTSGHPTSQARVAGVPFASLHPDNSQSGLETVIKKRLVETFISITIPEPPPETSYTTSPPVKQPAKQNVLPVDAKATRPRNALTQTPARKPLNSPAPVEKLRSPIRRGSAPSPQASSNPSHVRSSSATARGSKSPPPPPPTALTTPSTSSHSVPDIPSVPDYLSPIHRPSTNPLFTLGDQSKPEFAEWSNLSGQRLKIEIWGKVGKDGFFEKKTSLKGKERVPLSFEEPGDWSILDQWNISLGDLVPLPLDLAENPSRLHSNSLLVTLSPPGTVLYLPPALSSHARTPSPPAGYNSDPESEIRKVKQAGDLELSSSALFSPLTGSDVPRRRHRRQFGQPEDAPDVLVKSASWQDLFKLVTLQSCIMDNVASLDELTIRIEKILRADETFQMRREISEREVSLQNFRSAREATLQGNGQLWEAINARARRLEERRELLSSARQQQREDEDLYNETMSIVEEQSDRLVSLRSRFTPTRTTLLTTVSGIFPIDLFSPPDLLYTILDVPLPIPLSNTDPAPPLSLPMHKGVTEEAVATALGYVTQVLHLISAYLGKDLVYPVTCVGSRSLIRDGISAMVGPRMFPLYSKGVDTYRFEYAVFLLNKDIELLMADRDLRALDLRHTLPNLKNLLLTLTDGESASLRVLDSPIIKVSEFESPPTSPVVGGGPSTPRPTHRTELPAEAITPPASGSTTPTATPADDFRKSRPFLGLGQFSGFLRSYSSPSPKSPSRTQSSVTESVNEGPSSSLVATTTTQDGEELCDEEEEDDRRTIHGVPFEAKQADRPELIIEGGDHERAVEKRSEEEATSALENPSAILSTTHVH